MSSPKIAIGSWAFSFGPFAGAPWSFEAILDYAAKHGYDGVEINGFKPHPHPDDYDSEAKCAELLRSIRDRGLGISAYAPDFRDVPPDRCDPAAYLATLDKCLALCERCEIATLRVDTVSPPLALDRDEYRRRFERLTSTWRESAIRAVEHGVTIVWEFEPGFWLNKASEVLATVQAVDHPGFRLLFDTSHAYMGAVVASRHIGTPERLVDREHPDCGVAAYGAMVREYIGHLHLIDSDGTLHDAETSAHIAFGEGHIDFEASLASIRSVVDALPWWCVDFCFNPDGPQAAGRAVPFVRNLIGGSSP